MKEQKRNTKQKKIIYETLAMTKSHPTADWVYQEVRKSLPRVSLGTIYRNLNSLVEDGFVNEILAERNISRYDANTDNHAHLICTNCDEISDVFDIQIKHDPQKTMGFKVMRINVHYYGICSKCLNQGA